MLVQSYFMQCFNFFMISNTSDGFIRPRPWYVTNTEKNAKAPRQITWSVIFFIDFIKLF